MTKVREKEAKQQVGRRRNIMFDEISLIYYRMLTIYIEIKV